MDVEFHLWSLENRNYLNRLPVMLDHIGTHIFLESSFPGNMIYARFVELRHQVLDAELGESRFDDRASSGAVNAHDFEVGVEVLAWIVEWAHSPEGKTCMPYYI